MRRIREMKHNSSRPTSHWMDNTSDLKNKKEKLNLPQEEEQALRELTETKNIIIKPADKGSGVVIMDKQDYITEALRQLHNPEYYTPCQNQYTLKQKK